jgi:hypothetical protein
VLQEMTMTMTTQAAPHFRSAVQAASQAAAEAEMTHAPVRLAYWRMAALDTLLARLEELRVAGETTVPEDIREQVESYAGEHDSELAGQIEIRDDLNAVHDAVFEAQGRVMLQLAELRRVPNWQDLDLTLTPGDDEAA